MSAQTARQGPRPQPFAYPPSNIRQSSRSSYPSFLSIQDTLQLQLTWAWRGLRDACRWNLVIFTAAGDSEIRANIYKSLLLNLLSLTSIYTFDLLLLPLVRNQQKWLHRNVGWFYQVLWLLPVIGVSFYLNSSWCSIIAKRTYTLQHGTRAAALSLSLSQSHQSSTYTGMISAIATSAYRVVMVFTSIVVSFALANVPYVGGVAGFVFLCWIDAYYCFEFVWMARGLSLSRRVRHLEERWAYYFAFGLPSAAICTCGTGLANGALFALVFPAFIIMAMHARPLPIDPYSPLPSSSSSSSSSSYPSSSISNIHTNTNKYAAETETIRHPSPFIPIRLPIFAPVIWLNDWIVRILSVGGGRRSGGGGGASGGGRGSGRGRAWSETAESVEEGEGSGEAVELNAMRGSMTQTSRINIGRRKVD